jgi:hypothetical protein
MVVNFSSAPPANWLLSPVHKRLVAGDAVATAAAFGSIIADSQEVIDLIQVEMDVLQAAGPKPQADTLEGRIVRGVIAMCVTDQGRINPL